MALQELHAVGVQKAENLGVSLVIVILVQPQLYVVGVTKLYRHVVCVGLKTMYETGGVYVLPATLHVAMMAPVCVGDAVARLQV